VHGRPRFSEVTKYLDNYRKVRKWLNEISAINTPSGAATNSTEWSIAAIDFSVAATATVRELRSPDAVHAAVSTCNKLPRDKCRYSISSMAASAGQLGPVSPRLDLDADIETTDVRNCEI
jgi:hypothetical protein